MNHQPQPTLDPPSAELAEAGSLLVEDQRFAVVPEWVIDLDLSDAAFRLYTLLLRYGNTSGQRMPSRRLLAARLHRSIDSVDRTMHELESAGIVTVEHRRHGQQNLTNRYHLRTTPPGTPTIQGGGRTLAATPTDATAGSRSDAASPEVPGGRISAATPGRRSAARVAADLRPDPEVLTQTPPPPTPSPPAPGSGPGLVVQAHRRLLAACDIPDLDRLARQCAGYRHQLGLPTTRWAAPCLLAAIQLAVTTRGWPPHQVPGALLALSADPHTRSPMRLAEAGPWWDHPNPPTGGDSGDTDGDVRLADLDAELDDVAGRRPALQAQARTELAAEHQPVTRTTVTIRAVQILHRHQTSEVA